METKVPLSHILAVLSVPSIREEVGLSDEQISKLAEIKQNPLSVPFGEAIRPIKELLNLQQYKQLTRVLYQGLMVRAFAVLEVEDALELTSEQKDEIASIQANLKSALQPFQNKVNGGKAIDMIALDRDIAVFHEEAYKDAIKLLTQKQREIWDTIAKPVPLRKP